MPALHFLYRWYGFLSFLWREGVVSRWFHKFCLHPSINVQIFAGKTYRIRVSNVGISTSLNFRIQNHNLLLAEAEGSYTMQQNYTSLDIHVGQSSSFLVTMDQNASSDYYIVASARFVNESTWKRVTGVAILKYTNSKGKASGPLPDPPQDQFDKTFSMNQARSIRSVWLLSVINLILLSIYIYILQNSLTFCNKILENITNIALKDNSVLVIESIE